MVLKRERACGSYILGNEEAVGLHWIPASSNCVTYTSSELYATAATAFPSASGAASGATAKSSVASSTKSGSGPNATQTGGSAAMGSSTLAGVAAFAFAMVFLS